MNTPDKPRKSWLDRVVKSPGYESFSKRLLVIGSIVALCGLAGQFLFHVESMAVCVIVGLGVLAVVLYFKAYEHPRFLPFDESLEDTEKEPRQPLSFWASTPFAGFSQKMFGWGLCVFIVGLSFCIEHWPGWQTLLIIGVPTGLIGIVLKLIGDNARRTYYRM